MYKRNKKKSIIHQKRCIVFAFKKRWYQIFQKRTAASIRLNSENGLICFCVYACAHTHTHKTIFKTCASTISFYTHFNFKAHISEQRTTHTVYHSMTHDNIKWMMIMVMIMMMIFVRQRPCEKRRGKEKNNNYRNNTTGGKQHGEHGERDRAYCRYEILSM